MFEKIQVSHYIIFISLSWMTTISQSQEAIHFPMLMPNVQPLSPETYLCTAFKMPRFEHKFIVEYLPNATKETAHHILIYGCEAPGYFERDTPRAVWDCGEMSPGDQKSIIFPRASICQGQSQIVYSWAMDAPALKLPENVGFKVGGDTDIKYLVLQVHYAHVHRFISGEKDHSGITLRMLPQNNDEIQKLAGVLLMATGGRIQPNSQENFEVACRLKEPIVIFPFAFRTHTHKLGKLVSGYRIDHQSGEWQLIGRKNPQLPQMFYSIENPISIGQDDIVAARCTMYNNQTHTVWVGSTGNDEMCNFYIMYYVNRMDRILDQKICYSSGPPNFYWNTVALDVPPQLLKK